MRILNRADFLKQPEGVLFTKYTSMGQFDTLCVKHDTIIGTNGHAFDFRYQDCMEILADDSDEWLDVLKKAEAGVSFNLDLECGSRDGLFDADQLFVVFEQADLDVYRALLESCVPAVLSASVPEPIQNSESNERTEIKKSVQALAIACAPRCYYNYDPSTGRRPCTIDMERNHSAEAFKQLNLPSCPFKDACFTRSDCMYITGNDVSESEGAERVVRDLRQWDRSVTMPLTKENTQTLRPYL